LVGVETEGSTPVNRSDVKLGGHYALREKRNSPIERVKVLEHVRSGRWRVEWVDPNPGLVDFVKSGALLCPWGDRHKVVRDEERWGRLRASVESSGYRGADSTVAGAVDEVLESTGEDIWVDKGVLSGAPDALTRVAERAHLDLDLQRGFVDRHGQRHLGWAEGVDLARAFAAMEPNTVLLHVDLMEREYEAGAREPGRSYMLCLLEERRAGWALIRQWAGLDEERARARREIEDLRRVIDQAVWRLRQGNADPERIAAQLERAVRGG
jgi:hypothetical protein